MAINEIGEFVKTLDTGLRKNKYKVLLNVPSGVSGVDVNKFNLMVKASNTPSMVTGEIEIKFKGETIKAAGDESPEGTWDVTAYLNSGKAAATAKVLMEKWQQAALKKRDYKSDAEIHVYDVDGSTILLKYKVEGIWIASSGTIDLADELVDEIAEISISFNYDKVLPLH